MSVEHVSGNESAGESEQVNLELHLASIGSDDAKAWNVGLLLGVVSEYCRAMRFDPTTASSRGFHHFSGLLQSAACLLAESIPLRETLVAQFADFIDRIDGLYSTEWHAELLGAWRREESSDLRISTCEPLNLGLLQELVELIVPESARPAFLAGFAAGESWAQCQSQLRDDFPVRTLPRVSVVPVPGNVSSATNDLPRTFRVQFEPELESHVSLLFRDQGWNLDEWRSAVLRSGHDEDEWNQLSAVSVGISWISDRIAANDQSEIDLVTNPAEEDDPGSDPSAEIEPPRASDGFVDADYLGLSYSELARAVRREGYDTLLRFEGSLLPWHLFWTIVRRRDQWSNRETLRSCWQDAGCLEPESNDNNVIDRALSELREMISLLDLRLANSPRVGWRLVSC